MDRRWVEVVLWLTVPLVALAAALRLRELSRTALVREVPGGYCYL